MRRFPTILCAAVGFMIIFFGMIVIPAFSAEIVAADKHLVKYDTGVVYDPESGLEWYPGPDQAIDWQGARNWVAALDKAGGGWRMPTRNQLKTPSSASRTTLCTFKGP
jgi:hypothetical protein